MRRVYFSRVLIFVLAFFMAIFLVTTQTAVAKKITMKITTVQMPKQQMGEMATKFKDMVEKKMGDKVSVKMYPAAQLYGGKEEMEALQRGEIEMALPIGSKLENIDASLQVLKLPFLFPDIETAYKVIDGPVGENLFDNIAEKGVNVLGIFSSGNVVISNNKRLIKMPEDFEGLKMRSFGRMGKATLETLGAQAIVTPSSETFSALQQGVIDGLATPNTVFLKRNYQTIQKYVTDGAMMNFTNGAWVANTEWWNGLPEDIRSGLRQIVDQIVAEAREQVVTQNVEIIKEIDKAEAVEDTHRLTPEQSKAWKNTLQPVYEEFRDEIGGELIDRFQKKIDELSE